MNTSHPIRVILASANALTLAGLQTLFEAERDLAVVATACDGMQLVETAKARHRDADVVVMDYDLPRANGRAVIEYFRWQNLSLQVVLLATANDSTVIRQALAFGVEAVLDRNSAPDCMLTVVRQVHGGQLVYPESARLWMQPVQSPLAALSEREAGVLALAADGLTNPEIAERLVVSINTVKTHLRNVFDKLGVTNRTEASLLYHRYHTVE